MATTIDTLTVGAADRSADAVRVELWRTVNAVGNWMSLLRNEGDKFNGVFDIQDLFTATINGNALMRGRVDGPGVIRIGQDGEDIWEEFIQLSGVDQGQDLLFHNDFEFFYPDTTQQIKAVLNDVINVQLAGSTNIIYAPPAGATPVVGAVEFREGTSFLSTIQEMFREAGWIFYVDDALVLQSGAPGFIASGETLTSVAGGANNNVIGIVELKERDGDKLYNFIKLTGKNPMFDAYTELNAGTWTTLFGANGPTDVTSLVQVGTYSQRVYNTVPVTVQLAHVLNLPNFNYTTWDFSKGVIGLWAYYHNQAASGGAAPGAGTAAASLAVECRLIDNLGRSVQYYGSDTTIFRGDWGWCNWQLGEEYTSVIASVADQWFQAGGLTFDWSNVVQIRFHLPRLGAVGNLPSNFYIDGITLPVAPVAISQNAVAQGTYRRRPYVDQFPNIRTQNALQARSDQILTHHEGTGIDFIHLMVEGNTSLRYAGQTVDITIPQLGLNSAVFYMTEIHHVIEPYTDVTGLFGHDFITEVSAVPISGVAFDLGRLRDGPLYSPTQMSNRDGTGIRVK
jgi:hypothetical protein